MKNFLQRLLLFSIPVLLYVLTIFLVDPYNFFNSPLKIPEQRKLDVSFRLNYALWKYIDFHKNAPQKILLGDSRTNAIKSRQIEDITGEQYYNLAFGGGTLPEIIQSFWFASKKSNLKEVIMGINFSLYNGLQKRNRCIEAENILANRGLYFINQSVIQSTFYLLSDMITGKETVIGKPKKNKAQFWKYGLEVSARNLFREYAYPKKYNQQLKEIAAYCKKNQIKLKFVILPIHTDLQDRITHFQRSEDLKIFKSDMTALGKVYDFHLENKLTSDSDLFSDPFHAKKELLETVIRHIFDLVSPEEMEELEFMEKIDQ